MKLGCSRANFAKGISPGRPVTFDPNCIRRGNMAANFDAVAEGNYLDHVVDNQRRYRFSILFTHGARHPSKSLKRLVELRGIEPLTSAVRLQRSPI